MYITGIIGTIEEEGGGPYSGPEFQSYSFSVTIENVNGGTGINASYGYHANYGYGDNPTAGAVTPDYVPVSGMENVYLGSVCVIGGTKADAFSGSDGNELIQFGAHNDDTYNDSDIHLSGNHLYYIEAEDYNSNMVVLYDRENPSNGLFQVEPNQLGYQAFTEDGKSPTGNGFELFIPGPARQSIVDFWGNASGQVRKFNYTIGPPVDNTYNPRVTGVTISNKMEMNYGIDIAGSGFQLRWEMTFSDGRVSMDENVSFSSSSPSVTVSSDGILTVTANVDPVTVTITTQDGGFQDSVTFKAMKHYNSTPNRVDFQMYYTPEQDLGKGGIIPADWEFRRSRTTVSPQLGYFRLYALRQQENTTNLYLSLTFLPEMGISASTLSATMKILNESGSVILQKTIPNDFDFVDATWDNTYTVSEPARFTLKSGPTPLIFQDLKYYSLVLENINFTSSYDNRTFDVGTMYNNSCIMRNNPTYLVPNFMNIDEYNVPFVKTNATTDSGGHITLDVTYFPHIYDPYVSIYMHFLPSFYENIRPGTFNFWMGGNDYIGSYTSYGYEYHMTLTYSKVDIYTEGIKPRTWYAATSHSSRVVATRSPIHHDITAGTNGSSIGYRFGGNGSVNNRSFGGSSNLLLKVFEQDSDGNIHLHIDSNGSGATVSNFDATWLDIRMVGQGEYKSVHNATVINQNGDTLEYIWDQSDFNFKQGDIIYIGWGDVFINGDESSTPMLTNGNFEVQDSSWTLGDEGGKGNEYFELDIANGKLILGVVWDFSKALAMQQPSPSFTKGSKVRLTYTVSQMDATMHSAYALITDATEVGTTPPLNALGTYSRDYIINESSASVHIAAYKEVRDAVICYAQYDNVSISVLEAAKPIENKGFKVSNGVFWDYDWVGYAASNVTYENPIGYAANNTISILNTTVDIVAFGRNTGDSRDNILLYLDYTDSGLSESSFGSFSCNIRFKVFNRTVRDLSIANSLSSKFIIINQRKLVQYRWFTLNEPLFYYDVIQGNGEIQIEIQET